MKLINILFLLYFFQNGISQITPIEELTKKAKGTLETIESFHVVEDQNIVFTRTFSQDGSNSNTKFKIDYKVWDKLASKYLTENQKKNYRRTKDLLLRNLILLEENIESTDKRNVFFANWNKGHLQFNLRKFKKSKESFLAAEKLLTSGEVVLKKSLKANFYYDLTLLYYNKKDKIEFYKKAIENSPNRGYYYVNLANELINQKKDDEALPYLNVAKVIYPREHPFTYYLLAEIAYRKKKYSRALEYINFVFKKQDYFYSKGVSINKHNLNIYSLRGAIKIHTNDFLGAEKDLLRAIELNFKSSSAYKYLGELYIKAGEKSLGCECLGKAYELGYLQEYFFEENINNLINDNCGGFDCFLHKSVSLTNVMDKYRKFTKQKNIIYYRNRPNNELLNSLNKFINTDVFLSDYYSTETGIDQGFKVTTAIEANAFAVETITSSPVSFYWDDCLEHKNRENFNEGEKIHKDISNKHYLFNKLLGLESFFGNKNKIDSITEVYYDKGTLHLKIKNKGELKELHVYDKNSNLELILNFNEDNLGSIKSSKKFYPNGKVKTTWNMTKAKTKRKDFDFKGEETRNMFLDQIQILNKKISLETFSTNDILQRAYLRYLLGDYYLAHVDFFNYNKYEGSFNLEKKVKEFYVRGEIYNELEFYEKSIFYLSRALAIDKTKNVLNISIAKVLFNMKEYDLAKYYIQKSLVEHSLNAEGYKIQGLVYVQERNFDEACIAFERSKKINKIFLSKIEKQSSDQEYYKTDFNIGAEVGIKKKNLKEMDFDISPEEKIGMNLSKDEGFIYKSKTQIKDEISNIDRLIDSFCIETKGILSQKLEENNFKISPKIVKDFLIIMSDSVDRYQLLNFKSEILHQNIYKAGTKVNVEGLEKGLYTLKIYDKDKIYTRRFIKE